MNNKYQVVTLLGSAFLVLSCLEAPAQPITVYTDGDNGTLNAGSWTDANNFTSPVGVTPVVHQSPVTLGQTVIVQIGVVPSANSSNSVIVDTGGTAVIGSLIFNNTLNGTATVSNSNNESLQVNGAITNNSNFQQVVALPTFAGASATYAGGPAGGSLVFGTLETGTNTIATTGTVEVTSELFTTIDGNTPATYGHIGAITSDPTTNLEFHVDTLGSPYAAIAGDFFQVATGTFTQASLVVDSNDPALPSGLSYNSNLIHKGIIMVQPTAGTTVINSGVVLPIDKDNEFNVAGTAIIFNGTTSAAELLTDNAETATGTTTPVGTPFSTTRNITINSTSNSVIAAMNGTTATYGGVISDQGGTPGTLKIGDGTNTGTVVLATNNSTYTGGTTVAANTILEIANTAGSATGTGAVTLAAGDTLKGIATGADIGGQLNLVGTNTLTTTTGSLTVGSLSVGGTGNVISTGSTIAGNTTLGTAAALADNGTLSGTVTMTTGTLSGTGTITGASSVTGGTVNGTALAFTNASGVTFHGAGNTLSGTETGLVTVAGGGSLTQSTTGALTGALVLANGATSFTAAGTSSVGATTLNGGGNTLTGTTQLTTTGITVNGSGNTIAGTVIGAIGQNAASSLVVTGSAGSDALLAGSTLGGTGTVTTVTLAGTDTLTSTGTLHTSGVTVSGTGNVLGTGTVTGAITQNTASALSVTGTGATDALNTGAALSGTGTLTTITLAGTDTLSSTGTLTTSGVTVTGTGNSISGGTVAGAITQTGASALAVNGTGGTDALAAGATLSGTGTVTTVTLAGTDTLTSTGTLHTSGITISGTGNTLGTGTVTGAITQNANSALAVTGTAGADALAAGSTLSGSGTVGTVTLAGTDTVIGSTTLTTGGITVNGTSNTITGTVVGAITQNVGSTLAVNGTGGTDALLAGSTLSGTGTVSTVTLAGTDTLMSTGTLTTGGITVSGTGNTIITGSTITGATNLNPAAALADNGTLTGALTMTTGTLSGSGTVGGAVSVTGGTINGTALALTTGATFHGTTGNTLSGSETGPIIVAAGGSLTQTTGGNSAGTLTLGNGATSFTAAGTSTVGGVTLNGGGNTLTGTTNLTTTGITVNGSGNTIAGTVSGAITQSNASTLVVSGSVGSDAMGVGAFLSGTGTLTTVTMNDNQISSTGTLHTSGITVSFSGNTLGTGTITGPITQNANSGLTVTGTVGTDAIGTGAALDGTGTLTTLTLAGTDTLNSTGTLTTSGITVSGTGNKINTGTILGAITQNANSSFGVDGTGGSDVLGTGATLSGTGTLAGVSLAGTDTLTSTGTLHTSGITVAGAGNVIGTGIITGNTSLTGTAQVAVIGTLNGTMSVGAGTLTAGPTNTGTISGATTVGAGKIDLSAAASGTLSVGGLTTAAGSTLNFAVASGGLGNVSKIAVTSGTLSIGGATTINLAQLGTGTLASGFYSLLTFSGTASGLGNLTLGTTTIGGLTLTLDTTNHTGQVGVDVMAPNTTQNFSGTTPSTINIITRATTTVSTTLNNTSTTAPLAVSVADNGSTGGTVTGLTSSGGNSVATGGNTTITGTFTAGAVGTGKTYSISNTDPTALPTTITTGGAVNVYNHGTGTLSITSATPIKAITGTAVTSTLTLQNVGANNDNLTNVTGGTGTTGITGPLTANQTVTGTGTTTAGAAGTTTNASYSATYTEDQSVIGATAGAQTANSGTVTITNYNHAVGTLVLTSPTTVNAIAGTTVNSTLTFTNAGANNDNLTIQSVSAGVTGLSTTGTFTANQSVTTVNGAKTAGAAGTATTATYSATYLEDQSVLGATAGNQTATSATVTIDSFSHAVGVLVVTSPTTIRAITGTTINSTLTFGNVGATNDALIAGGATGGLTAATGTFTAGQSSPLTGSFVAGAAGSTTTNTFSQNYTEDQTVIGATTGTQTASAGVSVTAFGHSAPMLSATTDNIGFVHVGSTVANATTTLSNGAGNLAGLQIVSLGGLTDSGSGLIAAGAGRSLSATVSAATVGAVNTVYTIQTEDDQTILGAAANANQTFTVTGNIYSGQGVWNTNGGGAWGTINAPINWTAAGGAPGLDSNFTTTDSATFGAALTAGTGTVTLGTDNPSLKAVTFNDAAGSYVIAQGGTGTLHLNAGTGNTATISDLNGSHAISAPMLLDSATSVNVTNLADVLTLSGNIAGGATDSLTLGTGGAGKIILSGTNTFTGATTIASGTVQFQSANALTSSSVVTMTGGTLDVDGNAQTLQNFSSTGGTITNTGALTTLTFFEGNDPVNASTISGNVAVNKTGPGLLALTGNNTYTGGTTITAGTLDAGSATAFGVGAFANNGGTLGAYGAQHSINVVGNYTQAAGGTLMINLNTDAPTSANNDVLNVTGTASLSGALDVHFGFLPVKNDTFVVVTTTGGITTLGAGFSTPTVIDQAGILVTGALTGGGDDLTLTVTQAQLQLAPVLGGFYTPNRAAILNALSQPTLAATDPTLFNILATLVTGTAAAQLPTTVADTADQFNPAKFGNFVQSTIVNNAVFNTQELDSYWESQRSAHGDFLTSNTKLDSSGLTVMDPSMDPALANIGSRMLAWSPSPLSHGLLSDSGNPAVAGVDMKAAPTESLSSDNFSAFVVGSVVLAQNFSNSDVAHSDTTTGGMQIGADYRLTPHLRAGAIFGYNHTDGTLDTNLSKATIDTYAPGAYVSYADSGWYANGVASYGFNNYTEDRHLNLAGASAVAHGAPSGDQITANLDGGYDFHVNKMTFGPLVGLQYTHLSVDSYSEDGADALGSDLNVGGQHADSLRSRLGGHISYVIQTGKVLLTPHLDASWQHEFMDQAEGITASVGGSPFTVTTSHPSRDSALIDGGLNADLNGQVTVFGDYLIQAGQSNYFGQSVQAGVKIGF